MANQHTQSNPFNGIKLTARGLEEALHMRRQDAAKEKLSLRVYVEGKGCDGFYYGVAFDEPLAEDVHFPHEGLDVVVDPQSLQFLEGSEVDWVDDERGRGFLVENPRQSKFRGKFYKKQAWQDKLAAAKKQFNTQ